jgi:hypothetical protein
MKIFNFFLCATLVLLPIINCSRLAAADVHTASISVSGAGPFYRLSLPVTIYPTAARTDLTDVRIRNASGNFVPYAWLYDETSTPQVLSDAVAIFPIATPSGSEANTFTDMSVEFKQNKDGSLVSIQTKSRGTIDRNNGWILDVSQINRNLLQARFEVDENVEGFFSLSVDVSEDLNHWRTLSNDEQIVVLKRQGDTIEKLNVNLSNVRTKYLRISRLNDSHILSIKSVVIDSMQDSEAPVPLQWSAAISAHSCAENYCDYLLPAKTPVDSLRINLNELNTLAPISVFGKSEVKADEHFSRRHHPLYLLRRMRQPPVAQNQNDVFLAQAVVYRLTQNNREVRSENLAMDGRVYTSLRLQTQGSMAILGQVAPSIEVASTPRSLIFLGQGAAPYSLVWGRDEKPFSALALATLVPGYRADKPIIADVASVDIPLKIESINTVASKKRELGKSEKAQDFDKKLWLWGALVGGILLLAGMVLSLFKTMGSSAQNQEK